MSKKYKSTLCKLSSKDQVLVYYIHVDEHTDKSATVTRVAKTGLNGKPVINTHYVTRGKNIGRANETTPAEQAEIIANTQYNQKLDSGYKEFPEFETQSESDIRKILTAQGRTDASGNMIPMTAQKFKAGKTKLDFPVYVQPKLDGVRCMAEWEQIHIDDFPPNPLFVDSYGSHFVYRDDEFNFYVAFTDIEETMDFSMLAIRIKFYSRKGKTFKYVGHLAYAIYEILRTYELYEGDVNSLPSHFDGELFSDEITFQQITSAVASDNENNKLIGMRVFDIADESMSMKQRVFFLNKILKPTVSKIHEERIIDETFPIEVVETLEVNSIEEIKENFSRYIEDGHEGLMIRKRDKPYVSGKRSSALLKYKEFVEDEFVIVDVHEASNKDAGTAIFELMAKNEQTFRARPQGSHEIRASYWQNKEELIGKHATVVYQELTDDGIPRFPSLKTIRDYE